jgi:biopolymer transport protein ExbB
MHTMVYILIVLNYRLTLLSHNTDMNTTEELNLFTLLLKGGVVMIPIIILSIASIYIIIERFVAIKKAYNKDNLLVAQLNDQLQNGNIKAAKALCERNESSASKVLHSGLLVLGKPVKEIESMMETTTGIEVAEMEKRMGYLGLIAGIAPMLGFVGTIVGVIKIFYDISLSDNISIGIIASGLYQKMITSGSGLIVGLIAYCGYHILSMLIDKNVLQIQKQSFDFLRIIQLPTYEDQKK